MKETLYTRHRDTVEQMMVTNDRKATLQGNTTDDLQGSGQIDHQLRRTCLDSKPTRHQIQKNLIYTERGSEDRYWISQDVQYRSPTHRSRNAESYGTLQSYCLHSTWPDAWNQEMYVTPSQGLPLSDR